MLLSERYADSLKYLTYGQGYDIRIHAFQTAILILDVKYYEDSNINDINFGYYCSTTEDMVSQFQKYNNITIDKKINKETWESVFTQLKVLKKCTIIQTGPKRIEVIGTDDLLGNNIIDTNNDLDTGYSSDDNINITDNISYIENLNGENYLDNLNQFLPSNSGDTSSFFYYKYNESYGGKSFDDLVYNYIVSGGKVYNNASYSYNINGGESWSNKYITPLIFNSYGSANKDYDYIYNLLANSIYEGNLDASPMAVSFSNNDIGKFINPFAKSTNKPYFSPYSEVNFKNDALKNSKFDITIVYGSKGSKARKIIAVTPMAMSQEINASGEPIYDVYEFIAKDVVDGM